MLTTSTVIACFAFPRFRKVATCGLGGSKLCSMCGANERLIQKGQKLANRDPAYNAQAGQGDWNASKEASWQASYAAAAPAYQPPAQQQVGLI